jgi:hypothetical protein
MSASHRQTFPALPDGGRLTGRPSAFQGSGFSKLLRIAAIRAAHSSVSQVRSRCQRCAIRHAGAVWRNLEAYPGRP